MLNSYDRRQFNEIVAGLLAEDPEFGRKHCKPPRNLPPRPGVALLLWLSTPVVIALGGWTGLLMAAVGGAYGAHLWFRGRSLWSGRPRPR